MRPHWRQWCRRSSGPNGRRRRAAPHCAGPKCKKKSRILKNIANSEKSRILKKNRHPKVRLLFAQASPTGGIQAALCSAGCSHLHLPGWLGVLGRAKVAEDGIVVSLPLLWHQTTSGETEVWEDTATFAANVRQGNECFVLDPNGSLMRCSVECGCCYLPCITLPHAHS